MAPSAPKANRLGPFARPRSTQLNEWRGSTNSGIGGFGNQENVACDRLAHGALVVVFDD